MSGFIHELTFCFDQSQRKQFKAGTLGRAWAKRYPELFDEIDLRIYENQRERGYHFYEWLTAVLLFEATGYLSLVEKYGVKEHARKNVVWEKLAPEDVQELDCSGWPDLFCYTVDHSDWHFCEVKGPKDKLSKKQLRTFKKLYEATGRKVLVVWLEATKI